MSATDPVIDLVVNAMGYGVMYALERQGTLRAKLEALGPDDSLADALRSDAEKFISIRADLVEALR